MVKKLFIIFMLVFFAGIVIYLGYDFKLNVPTSGAPPYGESSEDVPEVSKSFEEVWVRPEGPAKVGLQAGHWKNSELPDELEKLKGSTGSSGGGKAEWEVNLAIAEEVASILKQQGIEVDILPATVPKDYFADVFLSIHADGNLNPAISGFKIARSWRDYTGKATRLVDILYNSYRKATELPQDLNGVSRNMRGYYAFSWWRYDHAIHRMTTAAIIETGFLSNYSDRNFLINNTEKVAKGIADGIIEYLEVESLL